MNYRFIVYILGWILNIQGIFMLVPSLVAVYYREKSGFAFLIAGGISLAAGVAATGRKPGNRSFYAKDGFVTVAMGWVVLSVSGALPFLISGEIPSVFDALFETISGYTTTGATILTDVEALSKKSSVLAKLYPFYRGNGNPCFRSLHSATCWRK